MDKAKLEQLQFEEINDSTEISTTDDKTNEEKLLSQNHSFAESAYYEKQIKLDFRSDIDIKIISPAKHEKFYKNSKIIFIWKSKINTTFFIETCDNHGKVVYSGETENKKLEIRSKILKQGLYYWQLETEDEKLYVNRFYVFK